MVRVNPFGNARLKEYSGAAEGEVWLDLDRQQLAILRQKVDLTAVGPPAGFVPAADRDLLLLVRPRNSFDPYFKLSGLVRGIGHRATVRRKVPMHEIARRIEEKLRLSIPAHGEKPKLRAR